MRLSVIICTYRRAAELVRLLECLEGQTHGQFETIVIDGSGDNDLVRVAFAAWNSERRRRLNSRYFEAPTGLTRQRNVGLAHAQGEIVCFFDDDVTFEKDFLRRAEQVLDAPENERVGGITGYDIRNWPQCPSMRWKLRQWLGVVPSLKPGDADSLGRNVPLSFAQHEQGHLRVRWLPGFCMVYRRAAIAGLAFDEALPTYGGEDRDFSLRVGQHWELLLCPELRLQHHHAPGHRVEGNRQVYETGFGQGRGFRKFAHGLRDWPRLVMHGCAEVAIDALGALRSPSWNAACQPVARLRGLVDGWRSLKKLPATETLPARTDLRKRKPNET